MSKFNHGDIVRIKWGYVGHGKRLIVQDSLTNWTGVVLVNVTTMAGVPYGPVSEDCLVAVGKW